MTEKPLALIAASLIWASLGCAQELLPARKVSNHELHSDHDPAVLIKLPASATYIGARRWTLYDVADCEVHVFVEADEKKHVQRLYWIQFEGYIESKPDARYDYSNDPVTEIDGRPFHVRARASAKNPTPRAGSDQEQVCRLVAERGYSLPYVSINVRLVNLFAQDRKELMVIYAEDMVPTGLSPADVASGGRAETRWPELESQIIEAAKDRIRFEWSDGR